MQIRASTRSRSSRATGPAATDQIAIDKSTAEDQQLKVGQTVGAYGDGPVKQYEISGIVRFGSVDSLAGASISVFDLPTAQRLFDKQGKLDLIRVGAKPGVSETELTRQIRPAPLRDHQGEHGRRPG